MSRAPSDNVRRAARALADLSRNGCVSVERRDELLVASGVPRGSWDRTVRALEGLGVVAVERTQPGDAKPCSFVVDVELARSISAGASPPKTVTPVRRARKDEQGWVYIAVAGPYLKIGWSSDPERRLTELRSESPEEVALLGSFPGTRIDESELLQAFAPYRTRGEWFSATSDVLQLAHSILERRGARESVGEPARVCEPAHRATLKTQKTAQNEETNNNGRDRELVSQRRADEDGLTPLERMIAKAVAIAVGTAVREAVAVLGSSPSPPARAPAPTVTPPARPEASPADLDVPPPAPCPVHGERVVVPRGSDRVLFWGCKGWRSDHGCGTQTISVEAHATNHRAAIASRALEAVRQTRQESERAERMRGRERPHDLTRLEPGQGKELIKARAARDPRVDPVPGDVVSTGGAERHVLTVAGGRVTWDVVGMAGEQHSAALEQWCRWAKGARVVKRGLPPVGQAVATLLESCRVVADKEPVTSP